MGFDFCVNPKKKAVLVDPWVITKTALASNKWRRDRDSNSGIDPIGTRGLSPALPRCLLSVSFCNGYASVLDKMAQCCLPPSPLLQKIEASLSCNRKTSCMLVCLEWAQVPRSGLALLWHGRAGRSQTKCKPCPWQETLPTWLSPKQMLAHFSCRIFDDDWYTFAVESWHRNSVAQNRLTPLTGWPCQGTICLPVQ